MRRCLLHSTGRAGIFACALATALGPLVAQVPGAAAPGKTAPAQFDPSDVYFQGWLLSRDAEKLRAEKKYPEALEKLNRARQLFDSVATYYPLWKPEMVSGRRQKTLDLIASVGPEANEESQRTAKAVAELEGGARAEVGEPEMSRPPPLQPDPPPNGPKPTQSLESQRVVELESKIQELQKTLSRRPDPNLADRNASRVGDLTAQRDLARAELKRANDELAQLRERFAAAPMREEMDKLAGQLATLEQEKAAMGRALGQSREETRKAREQIDALQAERSRLAQQAADLEKNLEDERQVQNEVIRGQQKQLRQLQEALRGKSDELTRANQKITSLETQLNEVRASFDELREERDGLLRERDQMAALLKLNEGGQIQQLIDQNMGLAKQLREASEKVERLNQNHNASQDQLLEAMRDLAIAKGNINDFKREKAAQDQRMADMEQRLRTEAENLAAQNNDPDEAEMLRGIIQKQLRVQERRRQASELLVDAVGDKAARDETIREALELFKSSELPLSQEETNLIKNQGVDDEFVSPFRRPREQVDASVAALQRENLPYTDAATRAYVNERFQSCRELFELVLERNPGDTATMCRLGNVHLRLQDPNAAAAVFRNATVIDTNNPYAHRMLGYSLMQTGNLGEALESIKRGVDLAPTNADGRVVLGKLFFDLGQEEDAEKQFKSAIAYDDANPLPHFNLAYLYAKQGKLKQGLACYRDAMERGAAPDLDLEKQLGGR